MSDASKGDLWVGVDLGTQSAKAMVVDDAGVVIAESVVPLTSIREAGRHEQDPAQWIAATSRTVGTALGGLAVSERKRVRGLALCSTSGTVTTVDASGRPTSAGLMYDDARAAGLAEETTAQDPELWGRLGYRPQPTWALPKLVQAARGGILSAGVFAAHQADVVAAAIVGTRVATDWSHALKSGFDTVELEWPGRMLAALGLDPALLPEVVAPGTALGTATESWSRETGLPEGTPVYAGMTDGCAAQLGAAAFGLGDWHSVIGTTFVAKAVSTRSVSDDAGAVYSHRAPHGDLWLPGGASNAGAGALTRLLPGADLDALTRELEGVPLSGIPVAYPLDGRGERFPVLRPGAEGFLVADGRERALTASAAPPLQVFAAVLLGVAFVERLSVESLSRAGVAVDGRFSTSGGGTRNRWWTQLRSDLLDRAIMVPASAEGAVGMAILAAWGSGGGELPAVAARMSRTARRHEPEAARHSELDDLYGRFRSILDEKGWT